MLELFFFCFFLIGPIEILLDMWRRQIVVIMSPNLADCKTGTTGQPARTTFSVIF